MKRVILLIMLLSAVSVCFSKNKTIVYDQNYGISHVEETKHYVIVNLSNEITHTQSVILYDKSGNEIYKFQELKNCIYCNVTEKYNFCIIVIAGSEEYRDSPENPDKICAYRLDNQSLAWEAESIADDYMMSPDGSYLSTSGSPFFRRGMNEIIDLKNGAREQIPVQSNVATHWINQEKLLIVRLESLSENPERHRQNKEISRLGKEMSKNKTFFKNGEISEENFIERQDELQMEIMKIRKQRKVYEIPNGWPKNTIWIHIYDVTKKQMLLEKDLYLENDKVFLMSSELNDLIGTDKNENIYLYGLASGDGKQDGWLIKVDKNGEYVWGHQFDKFFQPLKLIDDHDVYFIWRENDEDFVFDNNSGELIPLAEYEKKHQISLVDTTDYHFWSKAVKKYKDIQVNFKDRRIKFIL